MIKAGAIGEIAVTKHFLEQGYEVYSPINENAIYDLLVVKEDLVYKVEVKSTTVIRNNKYIVQLKRVRSNKTTNRIIYFDNTKVDFLAVYSVTDDVVIVLKGSDISSKTELTIERK